ncbi:methyltransferase [Candidatus Pacearchaeota archaeon]|nr:methyltransferase [Candidatus Pacearchaeota archaeon]
MIYEPAEDSKLLAKIVRKYSKGKKFLDIGAGSGVQSDAAITGGAERVIAIDIDPEAVKSLRLKGLNAIESDLFSEVDGKFDIIAFNPPYLPSDKREDEESKRITTGGEKGDEMVLKFLEKAPIYLDKNGIILIVLSSLTPKKRILEMMKRQGMRFDIEAQQNLFFEKLEVWKITSSRSSTSR